MSAIDIKESIETCGLSVPSSIIKLAEQEEVLGQALQGSSSGGWSHTGRFQASYNGPDLLSDLLAGLADGSTKPTEVHEALWAKAIKNAAAESMREEVERRRSNIGDKANTILDDNLDSLIKQARPGFEKALSDLAEVVSVLGPNPDTDAIMNLTGKKRQEANRAWDRRVEAKEAVKKAASIVTLVGGRSDLDGQCLAAWFLPSDTEPAQVLVAETILRRYRDDFSRLLAEGFDLTLNTPDQAAIVEEALGQAEADQEEAEKEALAAEKQALVDANRARGWK
ncbi:MAG TPA: hypothetical protein ENH15_05420 [Actinobacteria bacterium]|nr:hypothetical protein [Actinomycetota bacterium]